MQSFCKDTCDRVLATGLLAQLGTKLNESIVIHSVRDTENSSAQFLSFGKFICLALGVHLTCIRRQILYLSWKNLELKGKYFLLPLNSSCDIGDDIENIRDFVIVG